MAGSALLFPSCGESSPAKPCFWFRQARCFRPWAVIICAVLLTQVDFNQTMILAVTMLLALANWGWARKNG